MRRHGTRPIATEFGVEEMLVWRYALQPVDGLGEVVIGEHCTFDETVRRVLSDGWADGSAH